MLTLAYGCSLFRENTDFITIMQHPCILTYDCVMLV